MPTQHRKISVAASERPAVVSDLNGRLDELLDTVDLEDDAGLLRRLCELVPSYTPVAGDNKRF